MKGEMKTVGTYLNFREVPELLSRGAHPSDWDMVLNEDKRLLVAEFKHENCDKISNGQARMLKGMINRGITTVVCLHNNGTGRRVACSDCHNVATVEVMAVADVRLFNVNMGEQWYPGVDWGKFISWWWHNPTDAMTWHSYMKGEPWL